MTPELLARLLSGEGQALLAELAGMPEEQVLSTSQRLRAAGFDAELVSAALTQTGLRQRAIAKLGPRAAGLYLTRDGLEQATRAVVAREHARRLVDAGARSVLDLGCGIGSDALAFAEAGLRVTAVDADPGTAAVAAANLRGTDARVLTARAEDVPVTRSDAVWFDPARRSPGVADITGRTRRLFRLEDLSPSFDLVLRTATQVPRTAAKLSPMLPSRAVPDGCEAQWVSVDGGVVEATLWFGPLARVPGRTALVFSGGARHEVTAAPDRLERLAGLDDLAEHLYEPDPAVLAAGLAGAVAERTGGIELDDGVGLVSSAFAVDVPFARRYTVLGAMPYQPKALKAWLRRRGIGRVTVKKRGVPGDVEQITRMLRTDPRGPEGIVLLTRVRGRQVALLLERWNQAAERPL